MQHRSSEGKNVRAAGGRWFSIRGLVVGSILGGGFRILSLRVYLFYWLNSTTHKNRPKNQLPIYCSLFYAFTFGDCVGTWNSRNRYQSSLTQGNRPKNYYLQKSGRVHAWIERSPQQVIIEGRCGHLHSIWSLFLWRISDSQWSLISADKLKKWKICCYRKLATMNTAELASQD